MRKSPLPPLTWGGEPEAKPQKPFGTGKRATTILAEQGDFVTVISDVPYTVRSKASEKQDRPKKGLRSMHQTTLQIPAQNTTDYTTTSKATWTTNRMLLPTEVARPYPSQHITQFALNHRGEPPAGWGTNYSKDFFNKGAEPPSVLHKPTLTNKCHMTDGGGIRDVLTAPKQQPSYWTQYSRIHNTLGTLLGPGVPQERNIRSAYNVLTGQEKGPAWKPDNHRISGNRVLYGTFDRKEQAHNLLLG